MLRVLIVLAVVGVSIYTFLDVLTVPAAGQRLLRKPAWLLVAFVPLAGPLAWFLAGRPVGAAQPPGPPRRPVAPDDDPEFLRRLDEEARRRERDRPKDPEKRPDGE